MHKFRLLDALNAPEEDMDSPSDNQRAPLPCPSDVLYTPPNPDGSNKKCGNCVMYATGRGQCYIHEPALSIRPTSVCGYHVFCFAPMRMFTSVVSMQALTPEQSGLIQTEDGTSCSSCKYFAKDPREQGGECMAVIDPSSLPAFVEEKGCCARWTLGAPSLSEMLDESMEEEEEEEDLDEDEDLADDEAGY